MDQPPKRQLKKPPEDLQCHRQGIHGQPKTVTIEARMFGEGEPMTAGWDAAGPLEPKKGRKLGRSGNQ